jgi:hypothetical protein
MSFKPLRTSIEPQGRTEEDVEVDPSGGDHGVWGEFPLYFLYKKRGSRPLQSITIPSTFTFTADCLHKNRSHHTPNSSVKNAESLEVENPNPLSM